MSVVQSITKYVASKECLNNTFAHIHILTFIAKPDGILFLGHSNSVEWIRIPDSISSTALVSGLKHAQK